MKTAGLALGTKIHQPASQKLFKKYSVRLFNEYKDFLFASQQENKFKKPNYSTTIFSQLFLNEQTKSSSIPSPGFQIRFGT